ncbi:DUF7312 domain-containing protein [Natrinema salifodinae]|uniref:DUF7312 domain-containing protein n=1 Tax=Natrinema salifodinae TaxID=1202768 RepID=A0A1I0Q468_9EURY|nr:hypothetical protein [Natrinema salifodinae]SEW21763.1 hypothetical protein SAMN05216285_3057 [Natrinema salifodinae]
MTDESPGSGDDTEDPWRESSTDSNIETATDASGPGASGTDTGEDEWSVRDDRDDDGDRNRIPIDLSGSRDDDSDETDETGTEGEYVPEDSSTPIEPGDPDLENALFVLLGAVAMVLVLVRLVMIPMG